MKAFHSKWKKSQACEGDSLQSKIAENCEKYKKMMNQEDETFIGNILSQSNTLRKVWRVLAAWSMKVPATMPRGCNPCMRIFAESQSQNKVSKDRATLTLSLCWVSWVYHSKVWEVGVFPFEISELSFFSMKPKFEKEKSSEISFSKKKDTKSALC